MAETYCKSAVSDEPQMSGLSFRSPSFVVGRQAKNPTLPRKKAGRIGHPEALSGGDCCILNRCLALIASLIRIR